MGWKAVLLEQDGKVLKEVSIEKEIFVGRQRSCEICVEDSSVSRKHLKIVSRDGEVFAEKVSSFGKAFFHGEDFLKIQCSEGDVIEFGKYRLSIQKEEDSSSQAAPEMGVGNEECVETSEEKNSLEEEKLGGESEVKTGKTENPPGIETDAQLGGLAGVPTDSIEGIDSGMGSVPGGSEMGDQEISLNEESAGSNAVSIESPVNEDEKTSFVAAPSILLKLELQRGEANTDVFEIKKEEVLLGRGEDCDLILKDGKTSRHHAVLKRVGNRVLVKDLGSGNGTQVNGTFIEEETELVSEDRVQLGETVFVLKAMDLSYEEQKQELQKMSESVNEVAEVHEGENPVGEMLVPGMEEGKTPAASEEKGVLQTPSAQLPQGGVLAENLAGIGEESSAKTEKSSKSLFAKFKKLSRTKQILYSLLALSALLMLFNNEEEPVQKGKKNGKTALVQKGGKLSKIGAKRFKDLSSEQQKFVEAQRQIAFDYYINKDYDKALFELSKVFELIPDYKNAKEIERYAKEGKRRLERIKEEQKKREEEEKVRKRVETLRKNISLYMKEKQYKQAKLLFPEILALDPENQEVSKWQTKIEQYQEKKKREEEISKIQKEIHQKAKTLMKKAEENVKKEKYVLAIKILKKAIHMGVTDQELLESLNQKSKEAKDLLQAKVEPLLKEGKDYENQHEFEKAYRSYEKVLKYDSQRKEARDGMSRIQLTLHQRAKRLYTQGVISESYSDFIKAKQSFQRILEVVPKHDIYYKRAKRKLSRYVPFMEEENSLE